MTSLILLMVAMTCGAVLAEEVTFTATPPQVIDSVTPELSLECTTSVDAMILVTMAIRRDVSGDSSVVALNSHHKGIQVREDNRTSATSEMKGPESVMNVTIQQPTFEDEGIYTCRFVYLDKSFEVHILTASVNVTVTAPPEPEELPPVAIDVGCACDEVMEEIDALKDTMRAENEKLREEIKQHQIASTGYDGSCRASFSVGYNGWTQQQNPGKYVTYDDVSNNNGGAYDVTKSSFVAPCDGQYFFFLKVSLSDATSALKVKVTADGEGLMSADVNGMGIEGMTQSSTNGVTATLKKGQEVKVMIDLSEGYPFQSDFNGFFLFP